MSRVVPPPRILPWTVTSSVREGSYRIFEVDRCGVVDGAGGPRHDMYTIACADWCNVIALTEDDDVVMIWQYRLGTREMSLEIPGGVVDPGEAPDAAARRELLEETGYEATTLEPLTVLAPNPAVQTNLCHTFVARGVKKVAEPTLDENEELELVLVPASRLGELIDARQVTHALVHAALETFARHERKRRKP